MRARSSLLLFLLLGLLALAAPAAADILGPVDYHAAQTAANLGSDDPAKWTLFAGTGTPTWTTEGSGLNTVYVLRVPNVAQAAPWYKQFWLELEWNQGATIPTDAALGGAISLRTDSGYTVTADGWTTNPVTNASTGQWTITPQPAWEEVLLPGTLVAAYQGSLSRLEVASHCIPEPATMVSLVSGLLALGLVCLRRRAGR